uniref:Reverse transcriptase domain-containing protein n=1 Tax=Tanacetum cinerariifolium TaxID=118510 RepID=A0A6L2MTK4_TANCI|nr:reverse transcriptase domain-containing protein [Tanacetum cinerariifolium]
MIPGRSIEVFPGRFPNEAVMHPGRLFSLKIRGLPTWHFKEIVGVGVGYYPRDFECSCRHIPKVDAFLTLEDDSTLPEVDHSYFDLKGGIILLEAFLNDDPSLPPPNQKNYLPKVRKELKICEAIIDKSSIDEPPEVELKDLPPHLEYVFFVGDDKLPVIIAKDLSEEEKTALIKVLKSHKHQPLPKLGEESLHGQRGHRHKISKNGINVDKAKVDVIAKLPHPTTVKGIRSFLGHVGFYRRFIQDFLKIAQPMTHLLEKDTSFFFFKECVEAFQTLKIKLSEAPVLIAPD